MPRPSTDTRGLLLRTGQHLFAQDGVFAVSLTTILQQAGQRNTSALHYHFGGRQGLLDAIIERHDESIEAERRDFLADLEQRGLDKDLRSLVAALVVPFSRKLLDTDGREFLRIIAQLSHLFDAWDHPGSPEQARRVFLAIEDGLVLLPPEVRHLRVTTFDGRGSGASDRGRSPRPSAAPTPGPPGRGYSTARLRPSSTTRRSWPT